MKGNEEMHFERFDKRNLLIFVPCLLFAMPIIFSGVFYRDDYWRVVTGENFWGWAGRQGADQIAHVLSLSKFHVDSYPLGYILSIVFICYVLFIISKHYAIKKDYAILSLSFLFVSPFFLQNLAYRFDAPQMVLGVALSILAFYRSNGKSANTMVSALLLVLALCLYQPVVNIFLGLVAANFCFLIKKFYRDRFVMYVWDVAVFVLGYVLYYFFQVLINGGVARSGTVNSTELLGSLMDVFVYVYEISASLFVGYSLYFYGLFFLLSIFCMFLLYWDFVKSHLSVRKKVLASLVLLSMPVLLFFSATGPSFVLEEGVTDVRVLVGFASVFMFFAIPILKKMPFHMSTVVALLPVYIAIVLSFQFANATKAQRIFEDRILSNVSYDLSFSDTDFGDVYVAGVMPTAPMAKVIVEKQPFIDFILSPMASWISGPALFGQGNENVKISWELIGQDLVDDICLNVESPQIERKFYSIYNYEGRSIVYVGEEDLLCDES
ncbi:glucosyltransferase domain-containing protein [Halomonas sp. NyZ770]|uniref:glucosyltransferase domain-containing protein n=1 Tax=Halomonas sp. NyZ770 TaxID=2883106 RepID=UPI001D0AB6BE|nr:glucosyltransferase domain-containing protein [Halomonas sp. NyZ770]UDM05741.1 glucosyltransferase domain-containing protein [Halomonas sp. NyZ770]